jgi:hypothetical protein
VTAEHLFHRHADLSHAGARPRGLDRRVEQVAALLRPPFQLRQRRRAGGLVAAGADLLQPRDLRLAHRVVVDVEDVDRVFVILAVLVDADDHLLALVDHRLPPRGRFLDPELRQPLSTALVMPPISSTSSISFQAFSISSLVRLST